MQSEKRSLYAESSAPPSQVDDLYSYARSLRRHPKGFRALHLHFSLLDRLHKQPVHRRKIATAFNSLVHKNDGRLFWLGNFDLFFVCKNASVTALDRAVLEARRAVKESPVLQQYLDAGRDEELCDWYDLEKDFTAFLGKVETLKSEEGSSPNAEESDAPKPAGGALPSLKKLVEKLDKKVNAHAMPQKTVEGGASLAGKDRKTATTRPLYNPLLRQPEVPPMGPLELDKLERGLQNMDISRLIGRQDACVIVGNAPPQPVFTEIFISVDEIKNTILPGYDLHADKWLFQRLTRTFDIKLQQALISQIRDFTTVKSININVDTVLSPSFDSFIQEYKQVSSQPLILEMKLFDVLSDIGAYYEAQRKLAAQGCKMSIDAMDLQSVCVLDRKLLNVDFLKIRWSKAYPAMVQDVERLKVIEALKLHGKMRLIFCHCDSEQAVHFGQEIGIHMFQGYYIDKLQRR
ncbi:EAL domain-containing protein [Luteithermobacter gelatinilyticus]|uniref:EAL domain-containing protein n=1 Tax=Luteithermobacter gelatinilyticus TaxID=2582913 RepID=UPI00110600BD|nr:EAL domain-containing protein [Luteithermobacter gelatinilyticus]